MTENVQTLEAEKARGLNKAQAKSDDRFEAVIHNLDLDPVQHAYVEERWLGQVRWMSAKARENQRKFRGWGVTGLIISLLVPALISLTATQTTIRLGQVQADLAITLKVVTIVLSLIVSICTAIEKFFNYGDRWRHYRRVSELLKIEGWSFMTLSDAYKGQGSHRKAFDRFSDRVERILKADVDEYVLRASQDTGRTGGAG